MEKIAGIFYHCFADHQYVQLKPDENDAYVWMDPNSIVEMDNLLDGTMAILKEFYFKSLSNDDGL